MQCNVNSAFALDTVLIPTQHNFGGDSNACLQVAVVRSPSKLEQEQSFLVAKKLQELTGSKNIKMKPVIDESLIAGFIIEYGSSQIDMSIKGQLDKISQELENASFAF